MRSLLVDELMVRHAFWCQLHRNGIVMDLPAPAQGATISMSCGKSVARCFFVRLYCFALFRFSHTISGSAGSLK